MKKGFLNRLIAIPLMIAVGCMALIIGYSSKNDHDVGARVSAQSIYAGEEWYERNRINLESLFVGEVNSSVVMLYNENIEFEVNSVDGLINFSIMVASGLTFEGKTVFLSDNISYADNYPANSYIDKDKHMPIGTTVYPFSGTFDGCGYSVELIDFIAKAATEPVGFFGVIEDALVKNLVVKSFDTPFTQEINLSSFNDFAAFVGYADSSTVINCINYANITNSKVGGTAAGIVASGDDYYIANCVNYGKITTTAVGGIVSAITASDEGEVSLSINFGELAGVIEFDYAIAGHDVKDWYTVGNEWVTANSDGKINLLKTFNDGVHDLKHQNPRTVGTDEYVWLLPWGFDLTDSTKLALCYALTEPNTGVAPVLFENSRITYTQKNLAVEYITFLLTYRYDLVEDEEGSEFAIECRAELVSLYWNIIGELNALCIFDNLPGVEDITIETSNVLMAFTLDAAERLDAAYAKWLTYVEKQYGREIFSLAEDVITSWYWDCDDFIVGEDELASMARADLLKTYNDLMLELYETQFDNSMELFSQIKVFITDAIIKLDDVYYSWEIAVLVEEFKTAFNNITDAAGNAKNTAKVQAIYDAASAKIEAAREQFDDNHAWIEFTSAVEDVIYAAMADFDRLDHQWKEEKIQVIWISVSGSVLLLAVIIILFMVFAMRKKDKKYNAIIYNMTNEDKKVKNVSQKADAISREYQAQRERIDEIAKLQRERAEAIYKLEQQKKKQQNTSESMAQPQSPQSDVQNTADVGAPTSDQAPLSEEKSIKERKPKKESRDDDDDDVLTPEQLAELEEYKKKGGIDD